MNSELIDAETPYTVTADTRTPPPVYQKCIPEARNLFWNDDFFEDDDGVIAVFDFDYEKMTQFQTKIRAATQFSILCITGAHAGIVAGIYGAIVVLGLYILSLSPCFLRQQVTWEAESNHICITRDGIRFVNDKRKSCWGIGICDKGKSSKTVPFDKITDCDIIEPAGNAYLCFQRILYTVNVDTASSGGGGHRHELIIEGLKEPHRFKALVWAMKRAAIDGTTASALAASYYEAPPPTTKSSEKGSITVSQAKPTDHRTGLELTKSRSTSSSVLRDIRAELRENNQLLQSMVRQKEAN